MPIPPPLVRIAAFSLCSLLPLSAQGNEPPAPLPSLVTALPAAPAGNGVFVDRPGDGLVWAHGEDWKACFGDGAFTFVPFLGSDAPHDHPLTLRLVQARCGGTPLRLDRDPPPAAMGRRVAFARGTITEIYDLAPRHVEQSFVCATHPGDGDLTVTMAVQTGLTPIAEGDGAWRFANDRGGVRYGAAIAIDARGVRTNVPTSLADGELTLTVPAAFVADASFPLTIDPLLSTFGLVQPPNGFAHRNPDVAYLGTNHVTADDGVYVSVIEEVFSASDHDVRMHAYDRTGNLLFAGYVDSTTASWEQPRVASHVAANQFLCVATRNGFDIIGCNVYYTAPSSVPTFTLGNQHILHFGFGGPVTDPDVGGDAAVAATLPGNFCVSWSEAGAVRWTIVQTNGVVVSPAGNAVNFVNGATKPTLSKSCGTEAPIAQQWALVWEQAAGANNQDIHGALIGVAGNVVAPDFVISASTYSDTRPQVSSKTDFVGGVDRWMVVWQRYFPGSVIAATHDDIYGAIYDGTTNLTGEVDLTALLNRPTFAFQDGPCVDTDGTRFVVGFTELQSIFTTDWKPYLATVHLAGTSQLQVTSYPELVNTNVAADDHLQIAAEHSGATFTTRYMAVWDVTSQTPFSQECSGAFYRGHANLPPPYFNNALPGCGTVQMVPSGLPAIGETFALDLVGVQGIPFVLFGISAPPLPMCPGCDLGIDPTTMLVLPIASFVLTVPQNTALFQQQFAAQGLDLFAAGGCPATVLGFDFTLSNEIIVTIL